MDLRAGPKRLVFAAQWKKNFFYLRDEAAGGFAVAISIIIS